MPPIQRLSVYDQAVESWPEIQRSAVELQRLVTAHTAAGNTAKAKMGQEALDRTLLAMARLKADMEVFIRENPGAGFDPRVKDQQFWHNGEWKTCTHPTQGKVLAAFLAALEGKGPRYILATSGNQGGKSFIGADCLWRAGLRRPGQRFWCFASTQEQSILNQQRAFWELRRWTETMPRQPAYTSVKGFGFDNPKLVLRRPEWPKGEEPTIFAFKSYASGLEGAQSGAVDGLWLDEIPDEELFAEIMPRVMTRKGFILVTATFVRPDNVWWRIQDNQWDPKTGKGDWLVLNIWQADNPAQDQDEIERLKRNLPPDQIASRLYGIPTSKGGRVFRHFAQHEPTFVEVDKAPLRRDLRLIDLIDFHSSRAIAYLLCGVNESGQVFALDEMLFKGDIGVLCREIWHRRFGRELSNDEYQKLRSLGWRVAGKEGWARPSVTLFDSHAKVQAHFEEGGRAIDFRQLFARNGIPTRPAPRMDPGEKASMLDMAFAGLFSPATGKPMTRENLKEGETLQPQAIVTGACPELARQLLRLEWQVYRSSSPDRNPVKETPSDKDNDLVDLFGYAVVSYPQRQLSEKEKSRVERRSHHHRVVRRPQVTFGTQRVV